ncbi:KRRI-Interacting protein 1 [Cichlidogyrus casuarinus]|uniref:Protein KRI1 homolog n=1 Tax=Cichlidogyrus casuarinus TaxID=1844966 RepID=A0ABD2QCZ3_9PLAT
MESFKINKEFADKYKKQRAAEEIQRFKDRYGNLKVIKDSKTCEDSDIEDSSCSQSDSESESASELEEYDEENNRNFLNLVDALHKNDPALQDQSKHWFIDPAVQSEEKVETHKPVTLKDHEREVLLSNGVLEDDELIEKGNKVAKMDSDEILAKLGADNSTLEEFKNAKNIEENVKETKARPESSHKKLDHEKWRLSATGKPEDEAFLLNFFLNKKWVSSKKPAAAAAESSQQKGELSIDLKLTNKDVDSTEDDWLVKKDTNNDENDLTCKEVNSDQEAKENEENIEEDEIEEEEELDEADGDSHHILRSYPRKIHETLRQNDTKSRTEKRQEKKVRKEQQKREKMAQLYQIHKLQTEQLEEKVDKIKTSSGIEAMQDENQLVLAKLLDDEEWSPEKHEKLMNSLFNEDYYGQETEEIEKPDIGSDADNISEQSAMESQVEQEEEEEAPVRKRRKRKLKSASRLMKAVKAEKPKYDPDTYPDFDEYFDKFYKVKVDDLINGQKEGEDILCRFQYRKVKPNDFGLSTEEIILADDAELNQWVSLKKMTQFRDDDEEERDLNHFNGPKRQAKKTRVLKSIYDTEENLAEAEASGSQETKPKKAKRKRNRSPPASKKSEHDERLISAGLSHKELKKLKFSK